MEIRTGLLALARAMRKSRVLRRVMRRFIAPVLTPLTGADEETRWECRV